MQNQNTRPAGRAFPLGGVLLAIGLAAVLAFGYLMQYVWFPDGLLKKSERSNTRLVAEVSSSRGVRINEVMSSNSSALSDTSGGYPDWIELYNASDKAIDLSDWVLEDKQSRKTYFAFPKGTVLQADDYILVYATGRLSEEGELTAPFKLSSRGDSLLLFDAAGSLVQSMNLPQMGTDQSYSYMDGVWRITDEYTPGLPNTAESHMQLGSTQPAGDSALYINEVMADNKTTLQAADGGYYDWIELYNAGSEDVDLTGYSLSDNPDKPQRCKLSGVTVPAGGYVLLFASGKTENVGGQPHLSFRLAAERESVLLYGLSGEVLSRVDYDNLKADQSLARRSDGSYAVSQTPTPGAANGG